MSNGKQGMIYNAIAPGHTLFYEYDMGDTTRLRIRALERTQTGPGVLLIARNDPPEITCWTCRGQPAAQICLSCPEKERTGHGPLCEGCLGEHRKPEREGLEFVLPALNSPRTGVCGYEGPTASPDTEEQAIAFSRQHPANPEGELRTDPEETALSWKGEKGESLRIAFRENGRVRFSATKRRPGERQRSISEGEGRPDDAVRMARAMGMTMFGRETP